MSFVDQVRIQLAAGHGGRGAVHFHSSRRSPRSGPDGGDGGKGGDVLLTPSTSLKDLSHLKNNSLYKAENGHPGAEAKKKGAKGKNLSLFVPCDTFCQDLKGRVLYEVSHKPCLILRGGQGGKGNVFFKNPRNQAPQKAQKGKPGQMQTLFLNLKWKSDAALVGLRGAGKTSVALSLSGSKKKLYPSAIPGLFTVFHSGALTPVALKLVDLPGLGPHSLKFLKQAERTKLVVAVLSLDDEDPLKSYQSVREYISHYDQENKTTLSTRPEILLVRSGQGDKKSLLSRLKSFQKKHVKCHFLSCPLSQKQKQNLIKEISSYVSS